MEKFFSVFEFPFPVFEFPFPVFEIPFSVFEFPPPPSYVHSKKIDSDDSIFGEDSEHVDSEHVTSPDGCGKNPPGGKNLNQDLTRTNSITFNIKKGNIKRSQIKLKVISLV